MWRQLSDWDGSQYRTFPLSLPQQKGQHSGANIAETVAAIIFNFGLTPKLGYFVTDNASNNDTCLAELGTKFGFDPVPRCLRCIGHVINLVARAFLFGEDADALETELLVTKEPEPELALNELLSKPYADSSTAPPTASL